MSQLEKQVATLIKEVRQLRKLHDKQNFKTYTASQYAKAIGIAVTTLRQYCTRAKKGDEMYFHYLPKGVTKNGRKYWTQQQVDDFYGIGL